MSRSASRVELATALAVLALSSLMIASPAGADTGATVRAKTQRMTQATLKSQQDGWYNAGDRIKLVCSSRGQAVRGFFSFNIPNGGWDNLWYKTSDGHYVADVDIETGTLGVVAPDCSTIGGEKPGPPTGADRASRALAWARAQMASNPNNPVQCEAFVERAYNYSFRYDSAIAAFTDLKAKGQIHTNTDGIPAGALVFTSDPTFDKGLGHVMLSQGDGTYLTANYYTAPKIRVVPLNSNDPKSKFLGWAYAP
ncbi:MAG TPA: hypothetical protein PLI79_05655 [Mycobacterium sp.]|nr:hypothetical protein [Mycobacterium sp.]